MVMVAIGGSARTSAFNAGTKQGSVLQGDVTLITLQSRIRSELGAALKGMAGSYTNLSQIGVTFQKDGTLSVDAAKFEAALEAAHAAGIGYFDTSPWYGNGKSELRFGRVLQARPAL